MLSPVGLHHRSRFLQAVRRFFHEQGYVEVDTPARLPVLLPEAEIQPVASEDWFLQTSPESCMKRLLARGLRAVFQICPCWRGDEQGRLHESEFTMLEWYHTGWDYLDLMKECERFLLFLSHACQGFPGLASAEVLQRDSRRISLSPPFRRISVDEAFLRFASLSPEQALAEDLFDELLVTRVEPHLGWDGPVFLYDYPVSLASLARKKEQTPRLAERFELYLCGIELANGFSELVDPEEQRIRFGRELAEIKEKGGKAEMPEKFLAELGSMPDAAGIALGLDRLLMLFLEADCIADVRPFARQDL